MLNGLIKYPNGDKQWYLNGKLHREDGPAIERSDGYKEWWLNGQQHRENGPAFEHSSGYKEWWLNDLLHREDGPAIEYINGNKLKKPMEEYWLNGKKITKSEWKKYKLVKELAGIK